MVKWNRALDDLFDEVDEVTVEYDPDYIHQLLEWMEDPCPSDPLNPEAHLKKPREFTGMCIATRFARNDA